MFVRAIQMGISLSDMDDITIGFLLDLLEQNNNENQEEVIEVTPEMLKSF